MLTRKLLFLAFSAVFLDAVGGVCFCPVECLTCYTFDTYVYRPSACNDMEAAQECEKANWEIKDMQSALVPLVMLFLE